jgi:hypothetical protein
MPLEITDEPRRVQYAVSGAGPYFFEFAVIDEDDIAVYGDDDELLIGGDYTVALNEDGTGDITLLDPDAWDIVTLLGARPYIRATDFATGGDFRADTVNLEFNNFQIQIQQLLEAFGRSLIFPPSVEGLQHLPTDLAGQFLAFDEDGQPIAGQPIAGSFPVSAYAQTLLDDVDAKSARRTLGFLEVDPSMTPGEIQVQIDSAAVLRRQLVWRGGTYAYGSSQAVLPSKCDMIADGDVLVQRTVSGVVPLFYSSAKDGIRLRGFKLNHTGVDGVSADAAALYLLNCTNVDVEDVAALGKFYVGLCFDGCDGWRLVRPYTRGVVNRGIYPYRACKNGQIVHPDVDGREYGGSTATTGYGINFNLGGGASFQENVKVYGGTVRWVTHQGVEFGDNMRNCGASGTVVSDVTQFYGFLIQTANGNVGRRVTLTGCHATRCGQYGFYLTTAQWCALAGCIADFNTLDGFRFDAASLNALDGCIGINNVQAGASFTAASHRNSLNGGVYTSNGTGVSLASGTINNRYNSAIIYGNTTNIADSGTNSAGTNITA